MKKFTFLRALFSPDQFTQIEWAVRNDLHGKPLAQWLHGFYASHAKPYPVKVETLHKLCGSEATLLSDFKKDLRRNLDAVAMAAEANGEGFVYEISNGFVTLPYISSTKYIFNTIIIKNFTNFT